MTIKISNDVEVVAEGDTRAEAMVRLKDAYTGGLFYPVADGSGVHIRLPDENGDFHEVVVLTITEETETV